MVMDRGAVQLIDFRYYLVSIVSIFLALAVGIVLGAGPLQGDIGTRLTEQITALRLEKNQLRSQLDSANKDAAARDTFATALEPAAMKGRLKGKTVALVVEPGVDSDLITNATTALTDAGATVGATVTLTDSWADPTKSALRNSVATPFAMLTTVPVGAENPDPLAASVLAQSILAEPASPIVPLSPEANAALNGLKAGNLITTIPDKIAMSSSVVFLSGSVTGSSQADTTARLAEYLQLVRSLAAGGSGVVVAADSNTTDPTKSADLVAAVRASSDVVKVVSTVDDADLPMGQDTLVLALAQQYAGGVGQYGLAGDAKAIFPAGR
jgi:hypothetical protein